MAEVGHVVHNDAAGDTTTSSGYTSPTSADLTGTELDAQKTGAEDFFLLFTAGISANNTANINCNVRVHDGTSTLTASDTQLSSHNTASHRILPFMYIDVRTLDASAKTYSLEFASDGTATTTIRQATSLAINLDNLGASNYAWNEDSVNKANVGTGAWEDGAEITIGDGTSDWAVWFSSYWTYDSTGDVTRTQLDVGGTPRCEFGDESDHVDAQGCMAAFTVLKAPASSTTVKVQVRNFSNATNDCANTRVFAMRLDAFEDHFSAYTDGANVTHTTADTEQEADAISDTTSTNSQARDWGMVAGCILGGSMPANNSVQSRLNQKIDAAGEVTLDGTLVNGSHDWSVHDFSSNGSVSSILFGDISSVSHGATLNAILDVRSDDKSGGNYGTDDVGIAAFTFELAEVTTALPSFHGANRGIMRGVARGVG